MCEPQLRHVCPPETSGYLMKARKFPPSRRKYFYRLNGAAFTRHQSDQSPCREKVVVVGAVCKNHSHNGFILSLPQGDYVFYARNSFECEMWIVALRDASDFRLEHYYDVRKIIGTGGFAEVRVAYDHVTRAKVAVKTIDKKGSTDAFLQREISIMRKVRHPNVVQTIDIFESVNKYHIVMEFLSGGSLFDLMGGNRCFAECEVRHLMRQILVGLSYIHSRGIVHRDLKPENILLCGDDPYCAKIADFGLSNFHEECSEVLMKTLIGTPQFVAPELVRNEAYGMEVDAWACGILMYNLLTGNLPFSEAEVLTKFRSGNFTIEYVPSKWKHISREAQSLTRMLLCRDASRRLNAVGALRHKWFSRFRSEENVDMGGLITPTALMRFRKCVHAMRFLKRVLAKAGMVTTFKVEQLVIHRRENGVYRQSSSNSVGTADESEWDYIVQDVERMASRLDSIGVGSNPRSPREEFNEVCADWRGDRDNVLRSFSQASPASFGPASEHIVLSPVSPVSKTARTISNLPRRNEKFPELGRAGSVKAGFVNPAGSLGAAIKLDRANTAVPGGYVRPLHSLADNFYTLGGVGDESGNPSSHKVFKSVLSETPFTRSPTAVGELGLQTNSPVSGIVHSHGNDIGTNFDRDSDRDDIPLRKRGRVREATRRLFEGLRGSKKNAGR